MLNTIGLREADVVCSIPARTLIIRKFLRRVAFFYGRSPWKYWLVSIFIIETSPERKKYREENDEQNKND